MSTEVVVTSAASARDPFLQTLRAAWDGPPLEVYLDETAPLCFQTAHIQGWRETQITLPATGPERGIKPTSFRWDARKFAVKPFVWWDAARAFTGVLTWLDADMVPQRPVPSGLLTSVLQGHDIAYLGRGSMHPDTGYVGFRLPEALPVIAWCVEAYRSGAFRRIRDGWTDCHVFREALRAHPEVTALDLTSTQHRGTWASSVDAMALSPLGSYLVHLKGKQRKREALAG